MNYSHIINNLRVFKQLLIRDLVIFIPQYKDAVINTLIWHTLSATIFTYVMPSLGLAGFGTFIIITNIASSGFFNTTENVTGFLSDITGDRAISYYLTLPIPQWMIFAQIALANALKSLSIAIIMLPAGLLVLGDLHAFPHFCWWKFALILTLGNLFFGYFSLITTAFTKSIQTLNNTWLRIVFPLWYLGGSTFPWKKLDSVAPWLGKILLANPLTLVLEGTRAAALDPAISLPFWGCVLGIVFYIILMGYIGTTQLMKRLDCL